MAEVNMYEILVDSLREKGCTDTQILSEISKFFDAFGTFTTSGDDSKLDERSKVIYILEEFGVPKQNLGYEYLIEAVLEYRKEPCRNMTRGVYSKVAEKFGTSIDSVDSAIRGSIETASRRCKVETLQKLFGNIISEELGKPTNSQAIPTLAEKIDYFDFSALEEKNPFEDLILYYKEHDYSDHHIIVELGNVFEEFLVIQKLKEASTEENQTLKAEKSNIERVLERLGISINMVGYHYLMESVILYRQTINHNYNIFSEIYNKVACKYKTTSLGVERGITRVLDIATKKCRSSVMEEIFGVAYRPDIYHAITMLSKALD